MKQRAALIPWAREMHCCLDPFHRLSGRSWKESLSSYGLTGRGREELLTGGGSRAILQ